MKSDAHQSCRIRADGWIPQQPCRPDALRMLQSGMGFLKKDRTKAVISICVFCISRWLLLLWVKCLFSLNIMIVLCFAHKEGTGDDDRQDLGTENG